jgi:uncharacterized membrane protein HdeD (DUF308 family)
MPAESLSQSAASGHELHPLRDQWWCFLALGISLVVLGAAAVGSSFYATAGFVVFFGFLLLAGGAIQIVSSFWAGKWSGMLLHLLIGLLYGIVGLMVIDAPLESAIVLTKLIAIFLIVSGIFRIAAALVQRFPDWGWVMLNGGIALLLGLMINRQWPASGFWVIGLFVGIEMIFNGWAWIMLALGLRKINKLA